ncbi:LTA synthase family protein [Catenovulum sp. 2E275]|uniref:LTA synthase family protein n=1 Tax=Catenovulum sp. 2E275 TaxID=2980497 RepID=UPI0021CF224A|nr:LTA synthase family protein [Catenovulum sp. 2E275]MCU4675338.1 LTA synthase family protein [Catenovulum sp. 2E275]
MSYLRFFKPIFIFYFVLLLLFSLCRFGLLLWLNQRIQGADLSALISGGLRVDLSSSAYLSIPILLLSFIYFYSDIKFKPYICYLVKYYSVVVITLVILIEAATPAFISQYDIRPNRLFVEYLIYPKEVFSMLLSGHLVSLISSLMLSVFAFYMAKKWIPKLAEQQSTHNALFSFFTLAILFILCVLARGTTGPRPLNPALVYFSEDSLVNSLVLNSPYSVAFALKSLRNEKSSNQLYGNMPRQEIIDTVRSSSYRTNFYNEQIPTLAENKPYQTQQKKNLVIILEESLGARFVKTLGGSGITPELDKLYQQGWGFDNLYATGTRSVRGIEAVVTGFLPSPSRSVVKLSKSQRHFFTLAELLAQSGYHTQFIYGGESHFDNMKSFFLGNGFNQVIDFDDINKPEFVASWGVSDEDLFTQADQELTKLANIHQPFFSLIFTSSNHDPFEIPQGKVVLDDSYQTDKPKRDLAIKYADYALGQFIDKAKSSEYWHNTVFLVVADHDVRVYGSEPVPIKSFHIPAVILNTDFDKTRDARLVSQIDLPVTLLSLIGLETATPMTGFDLTQQYPVERAMMQYYDNFAYLENNQAVVLMPGGKTSFWDYDLASKKQTQLLPLMNNQQQQLHHKALAHVLFSSLAYQNQLYRLNAK